MGLLRQLWTEIQADDVPGLAAELAYRFLFALFPFFIFLAALGGFAAKWLGIENPTGRVMDQLASALPSNAASVVEEQLQTVLGNQRAGLLSVGVLAALWAASSAMKTVMKAMNRAYDVEEGRPFLKKQALGIAFTILAGVAFIAGFAALIAGQIAGEQIASAIGVSGVWTVIVEWAPIPLVLVVMLAAMAFVYWAAPNVEMPFRWVTPGSFAFVVTWIVATLGFAFYVSNFANYSATYGALGGVIVLMLWLYITAFVMLLGAELNAVLTKRAAPERIRHPSGETTAERRSQAASESGSQAGAAERERRPTREPLPPAPSAAGEARSLMRRSPVTTLLGAAVSALVLTRIIR